MKFYKTPTGIISIEDEESNLIQEDWTLLTDDDLQSITNYSKVQSQAQINAFAKQELSYNDWKVIRELERLLLKDTELNIEREALRASIIDA